MLSVPQKFTVYKYLNKLGSRAFGQATVKAIAGEKELAAEGGPSSASSSKTLAIADGPTPKKLKESTTQPASASKKDLVDGFGKNQMRDPIYKWRRAK